MEYLKYKIYKENNETANDFGGLPLNFQIAPPPAGLNFLKSNQWNTQHLQNTTPGCATSSTPLVVTRLVPVRSASRLPHCSMRGPRIHEDVGDGRGLSHPEFNVAGKSQSGKSWEINVYSIAMFDFGEDHPTIRTVNSFRVCGVSQLYRWDHHGNFWLVSMGKTYNQHGATNTWQDQSVLGIETT
jgi:hypothetical protein